MMLVNLPVNSEVQLVAPIDSCCNCGSTTDVRVAETDLRHMPMMGLAGAEISVALPFPYCPGCVKTARRRRPGLLGILAVSALLATVLAMCWLFFSPPLSEETTSFIVAPAIGALSLGMVLMFYLLRKPAGQQSSYYQPVKLKKTGHKWPADITGLELGFTNHQYAGQFSAANQRAIASRQLKVSRA
jgi:hypothetical protein